MSPAATRTLDLMQLTDVMATHVVSVSPDTKLGDAARRMVEADVGAAMVLDEAGDLAGVITERDLMRCVSDGTDPDDPRRAAHDHPRADRRRPTRTSPRRWR